MRTTDIEKRLVALEREIADLKADRQSTVKAHPIQSLERIHGSFENDEAFREAARLGLQWRKSQKLPTHKSKAKSK